eukprot:6437794-Amphidinium_carterae.1
MASILKLQGIPLKHSGGTRSDLRLSNPSFSMGLPLLGASKCLDSLEVLPATIGKDPQKSELKEFSSRLSFQRFWGKEDK